jgi:O-antigen ligase
MGWDDKRFVDIEEIKGILGDDPIRTASIFSCILLLILSPFWYGGVTPSFVALMESVATSLVVAHLIRMIRSGEIALAKTPADIPILLLIAAAVISIFFAQNKFRGIMAFYNILSAIFLFYIWSNIRPRPWEVEAILWAIMLSSFTQAMVPLVQHYWYGVERPAGLNVNPNLLAGYLIIGFSLAISLLLYGEGRGTAFKLLVGAIAIFTGLAIVVTSSRGGILCAVVATVSLAVFKRSWRIFGILAICLGLLLLTPNPFSRRLSEMSKDILAYKRINIWMSGLKMARDHILTGVGVGNYMDVEPKYMTGIKEAAARYARVAVFAHNEYIQSVAEMGIGGLIAFIGIGATIILSSWKLIRRGKDDFTPFRVAATVALIAVGTHAAFDFNLHSNAILIASSIIAATAGMPAVGEYRTSIPSRARFLCLVMIFSILSAFFILGPLISRAMLRGAASCIRRGDFDGAIRYARAATILAWGDAYPRIRLGDTYMVRFIKGGRKKTDDFVNAYVEYEIALMLNPSESHVYSRLLRMAELVSGGRGIRRGAFKYVEGILKRKIEANPYYAFDYLNLASLYIAVKDYRSAVPLLKKAVGLEPNFVRAHHLLAQALLALGRKEEAKAEEEKVKEIKAANIKPTTEYEAKILEGP